jgi:quinol monooxygenase YgiN
MWIRVGSFAVKPGSAGALRGTYNKRAVPKVRECSGNLACLLLEPTGDDHTFMAITIWESRDAGIAYEESATAAEVVALVAPLFAGPPLLRSYQSESMDGFPHGTERRDTAVEVKEWIPAPDPQFSAQPRGKP